MTPTTLKEAHRVLHKAVYVEDVFGELNGDPPASLKAAYRVWAKLTHVDLYRGAAEKKLAHEAFTRLQNWHAIAEDKIKSGKYGDRSAITKITVKTKTDVYIITERVASGDLCEIYSGTNQAKEPVVLKVTRTPANNDMTTNESQQLRYLWTDAPSRKLKAMLHVHKLLDTFELAQDKTKKRVNVFRRLDGYCTLQDVIDQYPEGLDPRDAAWMWNRMLTALLVTHQSGVVHGAVLPKHFMICPSTPSAHDGILIDWCYSTKQGSSLKAICPEEKFFYPPEVFAKKPAMPSLDIYMAALCMINLLGGQILKDRAVIPDSVPRPIKGLLKACLLSAAHRYKDVWEVFEEFEKALKQLYGPRKFRPFTMPRPTT
jgi:serine/threonine protein kinase